jgi:uncharacterized C2H2 Zn-finger protein
MMSNTESSCLNSSQGSLASSSSNNELESFKIQEALNKADNSFIMLPTVDQKTMGKMEQVKNQETMGKTEEIETEAKELSLLEKWASDSQEPESINSNSFSIISQGTGIHSPIHSVQDTSTPARLPSLLSESPPSAAGQSLFRPLVPQPQVIYSPGTLLLQKMPKSDIQYTPGSLLLNQSPSQKQSDDIQYGTGSLLLNKSSQSPQQKVAAPKADDIQCAAGSLLLNQSSESPMSDDIQYGTDSVLLHPSAQSFQQKKSPHFQPNHSIHPSVRPHNISTNPFLQNTAPALSNDLPPPLLPQVLTLADASVVPEIRPREPAPYSHTNEALANDMNPPTVFPDTFSASTEKPPLHASTSSVTQPVGTPHANASAAAHPTDTGATTLECPLCSKIFPTTEVEDLQKHVDKHLENNRACPICPAFYPVQHQKEFEEHVNQHFNDQEAEDAVRDWDLGID